MTLLAAAALWGFAEATLFFVVPDVLLTWIAIRRGLRPALVASAAAALGATLGGAVVVFWGAVEPEASRIIIERVPAISPAMIDEVARSVSTGWLTTLFLSAFSGVPYKIIAQQAGAQGIDPLLFLLATPAARLSRFVAASVLAAGAAACVRRTRFAGSTTTIWAGFWLVFYAVYWSIIAR